MEAAMEAAAEAAMEAGKASLEEVAPVAAAV